MAHHLPCSIPGQRGPAIPFSLVQVSGKVHSPTVRQPLSAANPQNWVGATLGRQQTELGA